MTQPGESDITHDQFLRARDLTKAGLKRRDAEALVRLWDRTPLWRRLEMFELAGNEEEAAIVRAEIERLSNLDRSDSDG